MCFNDARRTPKNKMMSRGQIMIKLCNKNDSSSIESKTSPTKAIEKNYDENVAQVAEISENAKNMSDIRTETNENVLPFENRSLSFLLQDSFLSKSIQFSDNSCSKFFSNLPEHETNRQMNFIQQVEWVPPGLVTQDVIVEYDGQTASNAIPSTLQVPFSHSTPNNSILTSFINEQTIIDNDSIPTRSSTDKSTPQTSNPKGRKKKGRKRKFPSQNRAIKKTKVNENKEYINYKGVRIQPRKFSGETPFNCKCPRKCTDKVSIETRKAEFEKFWGAGSYEARCAIIQGGVIEVGKSRTYTKNENSKRQFSRKYAISGIPVCQKTFLHTYKISQSRVNVALIKAREHGVKDCRGTGGGSNKLPSEKIDEIIDFIKQFPKYKSHYCRNKSNTKYLSPNLSLQKLYDLYKETHENPVVSLTVFKKVFYEKFDLHFKKPQKDTCLRCDVFNTNKQGITGKRLEDIELSHKTHLDHAASLREQMKKDLQQAKHDPEVETLTFDLQKTHNLPCIPTGVAYYKRQLNFFNLGIHSGSNDKGYFHTWLEHEAGRGTQEVGSCLRKYILEGLKPSATHLILWADSCGGQNRSINMILMLLHILLNHHNLNSITIRFLQPGHTFLPNDSEFGDVECALKNNPRLYTDFDYIQVMNNCRRKNKFTVKKMDRSDFLSVQPLLRAITNRKMDLEKNKISWLDTFEISLQKETPNLMYMKSKLSDPPKCVDISKTKNSKRAISNLKDIVLPPLWPEEKELSKEKIKDLKELLKLVPADCKGFYSFLKNPKSGEFDDDIEGFGRALDFDVEIEESDRENKMNP